MQEKMVYVPYEDFVKMVKAMEKIEILTHMAKTENYMAKSDILAVLGKDIEDEAGGEPDGR